MAADIVGSVDWVHSLGVDGVGVDGVGVVEEMSDFEQFFDGVSVRFIHVFQLQFDLGFGRQDVGAVLDKLDPLRFGRNVVAEVDG